MCGIAGISGPKALKYSNVITKMIQTMSRRGPDGNGLACFAEATLGHSRLSIFDLSPAGRQPMLTTDGQLGISFNGAIYNFKLLRRELENQGCVFQSRTDTEVLLHGYRQWGIDGLLSKLRGMFAFGLWDNIIQKLYLVRDRLGVKPLYYTKTRDHLFFASTASALSVALPNRVIDSIAVADLFQFGFVNEDRCIWSGCNKLQPGHILTWHHGSITTHRYWELPSTFIPSSFESAVLETERLLLDATSLRLEADVPLGTLLSGGIDSALVCWSALQHDSKIEAFTVSSRGDESDETADAARTARELGIRHHVVPGEDLSADDFLEHAAAYGEPFACQSALGMLLVSRAVRKAGLTVLLTGDGGDDVFLGYPRHRMLLRTSKIAQALPLGFTPLWEKIRVALPSTGVARRFRHLVDYTTGGLPAFLRANDNLSRLFEKGLGGRRIVDAATQISRQDIPSMLRARRSLEEYLAHDYKTQFVSEYLTKVDGGTMHYSLEARSPFLDHVMWEFAASMSYETRLNGGRLKAVLRKLAERHISPRLAKGSKRGFSVPVERTGWPALRSLLPEKSKDWHSVRHELLSDNISEELGTAVKQSAASEILWRAAALELWLRHHLN